MSVWLPVTIGTDDGSWAPPKLAEFALDDELNIVNACELRWTAHDRGNVVRMAAFIRGAWRVPWEIPAVPIRNRQDVIVAPGEMRIDVHLPPDVAVAPHELDAQRLLEPPGGRGRLSISAYHQPPPRA